MLQDFSEVYFYLKGTLKYRRIAIFLALIVCIFSWSYVFMMSDKYESKAKVHIDTETVIRPLMKGMVIDPDVTSMIRIIQQLMFTRPNLEKIVELSLLNKSISEGQDRVDFFEKLQKSIAIKSAGSRDIFDISYSSNDPEVAKSVVQAVLTVFSENTQGKAMADASDAQNFIGQQIRDYEIRLQEAEKSKEEFRRNNMDLLMESDQVHSLLGIRKELQDANTLLQQQQAKKNVLGTQLKQVKESDNENWAVGGAVGAQDIKTPEGSKLQSLKDKKAELMLKYTDRHPDIAGIDDLIVDLEKNAAIQAKHSESIQDDQIGAEKLSNPYVQTLKSAYDNADAEVAATQALVDSLSERIRKLEEGMKERLSLETEMINLNRDYDTISKQYSTLLERREQAHITERIDDQASRLKFKIADPPTRPLKPAFPNRIVFYSLILVMGISIGFAVAFLIYFIKPVFMSNRQVRDITGLPSLGSVSFVSQCEVKVLEKDWAFILSFAALFIGYTGMMLIELLKK